jgi:hypothetical protein
VGRISVVIQATDLFAQAVNGDLRPDARKTALLRGGQQIRCRFFSRSFEFPKFRERDAANQIGTENRQQQHRIFRMIVV